MKKSEPHLFEGKLRTIEKRLINVIANLGYLKGRSPKFSEITAYVYVHQEVTQKILRELTGYSLGTISTVLQILEKQGIIRKHLNPDTREYHYELYGTLSQIGSRSLTHVQQYFSEIKEFFQAIEAKLAQSNLSKKKGYRNIRQLVDEMSILVPAYERVLERFQTSFQALSQKARSETSDIK